MIEQAQDSVRLFRTARATASGPHQTIEFDDTWAELESRVARVPSSAQIRGVFLSQLKDMMPAGALTDKRYIPFKLYPVAEYMALQVLAAKAKYPRLTAGTALLRLGRGVYPLFASTVAGSAIFAMAHHSFKRICELSPQAYNVTLSPGESKVGSVGDNEATIYLNNVWAFPDLFHAGIWLGAMQVCNSIGTVEVVRRSHCSVEFRMRWEAG